MKKESAAEFISRKNKQFKQGKDAIRMKDIGREGKLRFKREAWTFLPQNDMDEKVFVFERFRKLASEGNLAYPESWKTDDIDYRIGYYIVGKIGKAKGRWVWGQYCPIIPHIDLVRLMDKAKKEKVILD